jgi:ABC-type Fe3+/spermidine/putrescine transport system ATPase subunit
MSRVSITNLSKTYPGSKSPALDGFSLELAPGELVALLGPSGCGKTTALKAIAGLLEPDQGDVTIDEKSIRGLKPESRSLAMVFQQPLLFPYMTVAQNIGFGLRMRRMGAVEADAKVSAMLAKLRLSELGERKPSELSGGQQQRVALARALVIEPKVLLMDEPFASLDTALRQEMQDLLRTLIAQTGTTTLFVTHDQSEAVALAGHIALMQAGQLRQVATPEEIYACPTDSEVARFFGGRNFLTGKVQDCEFHASFGMIVLPTGFANGEGILTIRPEAVMLGQGFPGSVLERKFLGTETQLKVQVGQEVIELSAAPGRVAGVKVGDSMMVDFPPQSVWVLRA